MEINEKVTAVVTGGASGLGEATSRMLSSLGANVAIFDHFSRTYRSYIERTN